eukprot:2717983-Rhodomonas_salina.1
MGNFLQNTCNFAIDSFYSLDEIGPELEAYGYWSVYHKDGTERARMAQDCRALELLTENGDASDAAGETGEVAQLQEENKALREQMDQVTRLNCELVQNTWALQESKARVLQLDAVLSELESRLVGIKTQSTRDLVAAHDLLEAERARRRLACECRVSTVNTVRCKFGSTACAENMALALDYFALQRGVDAPRALSHGCEQLRRVIPLKSMLGYATTCRFLLQLDEQSAVFLVGRDGDGRLPAAKVESRGRGVGVAKASHEADDLDGLARVRVPDGQDFGVHLEVPLRAHSGQSLVSDRGARSTHLEERRAQAPRGDLVDNHAVVRGDSRAAVDRHDAR